MRILLQRVLSASVRINGAIHSSVGAGMLVFVGIEEADQREDVEWLVKKIASLRIFSDDEGKMNLDIRQVNGEFLVVSQFTLHAQVKKGNRPSFIVAARPEKAIPLYEYFIESLEKESGVICAQGKFGADMKIELINDGPVTIWIDTKNKE